MKGPLDTCVIHATRSLRDALDSLEKSGTQIVLVVDDERRLVGLLTDGDVRRALLGGASLESTVEPVMRRAFTAVAAGASRAEVLELMQARRLGAVPTVDADGRLSGLHLLHDVLGVEVRPSWAIVMAGGRGTRLGALTASVPKPMVRVAGRPILERILLHLMHHGIRRVFLSVSYLAHVIEDYFGDGSRIGCRIEYLREDRPLGTGGAVSLLPDLPTAPLLVMNGDLVTQANVGAMIDAHEAGGQAATMGVRRYYHTVPFGCVDVEHGAIVRMVEKPQISATINAGIYVLSPALAARVPKGVEIGMPNLLEGAMERGETVRVFEIEEDWIDVGQFDQLAQARGQ